jgi:molybdate transport system ATP-binding protein
MNLRVQITKQLGDFTCHADCTISHHKFGVFGPSGSGKSTLMAMLAGLIRPDSGVITLGGETLFDHYKGINLPPERRRIAIVFQHAYLFPHLNVENNLLYGYRRSRSTGTPATPTAVIDMLHLQPLLQRGVNKLSGGERQRVALGRAILSQPRLILLDEPLSGLDGSLKYQIIPYLQRAFERCNLPFIFISHSLEELRLMTDEVMSMNNGATGEPMSTETLARSRVGNDIEEYDNLLELREPLECGNLVRFHWGPTEVTALRTTPATAGTYRLSSRDILLFKKHPEAASARNMLSCTVRDTKDSDWLSTIELDCHGNILIAEIVPQSLTELDIRPGSTVIAVFKASALRRLW